MSCWCDWCVCHVTISLLLSTGVVVVSVLVLILAMSAVLAVFLVLMLVMIGAVALVVVVACMVLGDGLGRCCYWCCCYDAVNVGMYRDVACCTYACDRVVVDVAGVIGGGIGVCIYGFGIVPFILLVVPVDMAVLSVL